MSNLWKALRDVSRDVDPTVGFEPPAHGLGSDGALPGSPASDQGESSPVESDDISPAASNRLVPPRPVPASLRPPIAGRPRPGAPAPSPATKERAAPLQSPLQRQALASALQFDTPEPSNIVRPPQFNAVEGPAPGPSWASAEPAGPAPAPAPASASPKVPSTPARSRLSSILEAGASAAATTAARPDDAPSTPEPRPRFGAAAPAKPVSYAGADHRSPVTGSAAYRDAGTPAGTGAARYGGAARPTATGAPFSPAPGLPDALKPFAPGSPNIQMDMAAMSMSPRWKPGDDDVMPGDGHKGARRPRLRDRLPW